MPPKAKAAGKGRAPAKRKLAEEFPPGETLTDTGKHTWKLGKPIGQGGFGLLYLAAECTPDKVGDGARYVVKVEPSENGPLFSELKFYMRAAKPDLIQNWMRSHKLKYLGVPNYWGSGLHEKGGKRYRFMVMDRLGTDLQKKFEECGKRFPRKLVLQLGLKLLDIVEYIHEHEYVHADIKASNLLLSYANPNQVYLVDYGLAYRYSPEGVLKEYKEDPKRCHDGTIEFTSIDAHKGVSPSRRADLEILGYCLVQWLCGRLPWEDKLQDPVYVRDSKIRCMDNIPQFMSTCFPHPHDKPAELQSFLQEVKTLGYADKPDYQRLRSVLQAGLKSIGAKEDGKLDFSHAANGVAPSANGDAPPAKKTGTKRKKESKAPAEEEEEEEEEPDTDAPAKKKKAASNKRQRASPKKTATASPKKKTATARPKKTATERGTQMTPVASRKATAARATQTTPGVSTQTSPAPTAKKPRGRPTKAC